MPQSPARSSSVVRPRSRTVALLVSLLAALLSVQAVVAVQASAADPVPVAYQDQTFPTAGSTPTEDKPQSKLWFNDGSWWALMRTTANGTDGNPDIAIYQLQANHTWVNSGTVVDGRAESTGDALWDGTKLYVASRVTSGSVVAARLSYNATTHKYSMDAGLPVTITTGAIESVTITKDSVGRLWVTFTRSSRVYVAHTTTDDAHWTAPFLVPVSDNTLKADDISAIISFSGKVGVLYSDQQSQVVRFAVHPDTSADNTGWTMESAYNKGARSADDHLNLKALTADDSGRIYAAIKTSRGDVSTDAPTDPSIVVLSRSSTGTWTPTTASPLSEGLTRPQLVLDSTNKQLYVVMSTEGGGNVYYRRSPLGATMSFTPRATLMSFSGAKINDSTTAKAPVTPATGMVVLASDAKVTMRYYHAELALTGGTPVADTTAPTVPTAVTAKADTANQVTVSWTASTDAVGVASYQVTRNGTVIGSPVTSGTSFVDTTVAPSTAYSYTVSAVDAAGNRSAESTPPASVTTPAPTSTVPVASFTASPTSGAAPLAVQFTDTSTNTPTSWAWNFGDGGTATTKSPSHTFQAAGTYTVSLVATNASGSSAASTQTITASGTTPNPTGGTITVGASSQAVSTALVTAVTVGKPAGVKDGDVLVTQFTAHATPTVSAAPAGWSTVTAALAIGAGAKTFVYYHVVSSAASEPASWTWTLSSAQKWNAVMTAYSGVNTTTPFDSAVSTFGGSSTASTTVTVPGVTTTTPGALLIGGVGIYSASATVTPPSGWTESIESSGAHVTEDASQPRPTAGATGSASWTLSSSVAAAGWMRALRPS